MSRRSQAKRAARAKPRERSTGMEHLPVRGGYDPLGFARGELAGDTAALTAGAVEDS